MTLEEVQAELLKVQDEVKTIKTENEALKNDNIAKEKRVNELLEHNNKLFTRITNKVDEEETKDEIHISLDEETYKLLGKYEKNLLKDIIENDEEE